MLLLQDSVSLVVKWDCEVPLPFSLVGDQWRKPVEELREFCVFAV